MKKKILKIAVWTVSITLVLFITLVVHIYLVTKPAHYDNNDLQLSRIDFKQDLDAQEAGRMTHFIAGLPGIQNVLYNPQSRTLIYGYNNGEQNSTNVFNQLISFGHYNAQRFVPSAAQLSGGCPMGKNKDSFLYKCAALVGRLF